MNKTILSFLLAMLMAGGLAAQSLHSFADKPVSTMFDFHFSKPEWRNELGRPSVFASDRGYETHFFAYGVAMSGVAVKTAQQENGTYAGQNDWVNFIMLHDAEDSEGYIKLEKGTGMLIWVYSTAFTSHEENLDTKVYFHFLAWLPAYPETKDAQIYYVEDFRSGGTAEVFTLVPGAAIALREEYGMLTISAKLKYDNFFGGGELDATLDFTGAIETRSFE